VTTTEFGRLPFVGKPPPLSKGYGIRVNGDPLSCTSRPDGPHILTRAGLLPAENYTLHVKLAGEKPKNIGLDECRLPPCWRVTRHDDGTATLHPSV